MINDDDDDDDARICQLNNSMHLIVICPQGICNHLCANLAIVTIVAS